MVMGNSNASSVARPLESQELSQPGFERAPEHPREFHFAVTWVTLFAHLDLIESKGRFTYVAPSASQALIPVVATPLPEIARPDPGAGFGAAAWDTPAWEMTVPKMIRTGTGAFTPAQESEAS